MTTTGVKGPRSVRVPAEREPTHPGEMLLEEFLVPLGITQKEFADRIGVSYVRLNEIVNGRRGVTPSTALRFAKAFGTSPEFWLNGQTALDLYRAMHDEGRHRRSDASSPSSVRCQGNSTLAAAPGR